MALCAYHEDTEAVATCTGCKSPICGKCQEFGADGRCGMCVEMASARRSTPEPARASRDVGPSGPARSPTGGLSRPPSPSAKPPSGALARPGGSKPLAPKGQPPKAAGTVPATKGGFCAEHDGQQITAACTNCRKKVCPYCLDLYDLCVECRALPHCSRHEAMVSAARCESCNLEYCRLCLDNTPFCDRCRTLGMAKVSASRHAGRAPTGKLDPPKAPHRPQPAPKPASAAAPATQDAARPDGGATPRKVPIARPAPGQPGHRPAPPAGKQARAKGGGPHPLVLVGGGLVLFGAAAYLFFADPRPRLSAGEANTAIRAEMTLVQAAAAAIVKSTGQAPSTSDQVLEQLKAQGVDLDKLNPPLKVVVDVPPAEPLTVAIKTFPRGFEVRALDAAGAPLAEDGRDVVLHHWPDDGKWGGKKPGDAPAPDEDRR